MCLAPWPDRVGCSVLCLQVNIQGIGDLLEKWIKASTVLEDHLPEGDPVLAEWKENMQHWVEIMNAIQVVFAPFFKVMSDVNRNFCECLLDSELKQQFRRLSLSIAHLVSYEAGTLGWQRSADPTTTVTVNVCMFLLLQFMFGIFPFCIHAPCTSTHLASECFRAGL